ATDLTELVCASKVRITCPLEASHKLIVLALADSRRVPSGEIATDQTGERWLSVWITCPLAASHSFRVWSPPPDSKCVPSGENATDSTEPEVPAKVRSSWPLAASHSLS